MTTTTTTAGNAALVARDGSYLRNGGAGSAAGRRP